MVACSVLVAGVLVGCSKGMKNNPDTAGSDNTANVENMIAQGDVVRVDYVGSTAEDGVFDTSLQDVAEAEELYNELRDYQPLEFEVGASQMIPGFEKGVIGMKVGETKTIVIPAEEGYGEIKPELVQELPKSNFVDANIEPQVGETYNFGIAQGKVLEVNEETVKIDFNHFLAGKTLTFEVTIKEIIKADVANNQADAVEVEENTVVEEEVVVQDTGAADTVQE